MVVTLCWQGVKITRAAPYIVMPGLSNHHLLRNAFLRLTLLPADEMQTTNSTSAMPFWMTFRDAQNAQRTKQGSMKVLNVQASVSPCDQAAPMAVDQPS